MFNNIMRYIINFWFPFCWNNNDERFNLPIEDINKLIQSNNLNKKCQERRCAVNNQILDEQQKNENNYYEYLCNYDPTSEFEEINESNDSLNDNNNRNNDTLNRKNDKIICTQINKNDIIISLFENNYVFKIFIYVRELKLQISLTLRKILSVLKKVI